MDVAEAMDKLRDRLGREQVFGEPVTQDGTIVLPVARISAGAGGGEGEDAEGAAHGRRGRGRGSGLGFRFGAAPAGVYSIRGGEVTWQPAVNVNRVILGGQILGALALGVLYAFIRGRQAAAAAVPAPVAVIEAAEEPTPDPGT